MNNLNVQLVNIHVMRRLLGWLCAMGLIVYGGSQTHVACAQQISPVSEAQPKKTTNTRPTPAMEAEATKRINRLSDELKSPFCPGKTLLTCTSPEAFKLRREMRQMILEGYDDRDILKVISKSFDQPLENPPQPWITLLVPVFPFIFGLIIALWVFLYWRRSSSSEMFNRGEAEAVEVDAEHKYYERLQDLLDDEE